MNKPVCTVMVGLPALGKSTFIKSIKTADTWIYSTDMFIEAVAEDNGITYDASFLSNIDAATKFNDQKVETMMMLQKDIIWDQTNLGIKKRKKIVDMMTSAGYTVNCICILPPSPSHISDQKDWTARLNSRPGKTIPNHVLANMIENFTVPTYEEGFDKISMYNMFGAALKGDNE